MIRTGLIWSAIALAIMVACIGVAYHVLPTGQDVPVRFDGDGQPVAFVGKTEALLSLAAMPAVMAFSTLVFAIAPAIEPFRKGLEKSEKAYLAIWVGALVLMTLTMVAITVMVTAEERTPMSAWFPRLILVGAGVLMGLVGNVLPKTRPNWIVGIRTPWTLTSPTAWEKTHRVGGPLFVAFGALIAVTALILEPSIVARAIGVGVIGLVVWLFVYSWWVWRKSDDGHGGPTYAD